MALETRKSQQNANRLGKADVVRTAINAELDADLKTSLAKADNIETRIQLLLVQIARNTTPR